ncbi:MAG: hypothetical protein AB1589_22185 [Cyanobacteriota bacterium]
MIPIIIGAGALGSAAIGTFVGAAGKADIDSAQEITKRAQERYECAVTNLQAKFEAINNLAAAYDQLQIRIQARTIGRFVSFVERIGQRASQSDMRFLEGLDISIEQLKEYKPAFLEAEKASKGLVSATNAGMAADANAVGVAHAFGTVTVPQLFGLFTTKVAVSQLGIAGVSTYLGGGNMALGGAVLGGIALGSALIVGGLHLAGKGEKALAEARKYQAKVETEISKIETVQKFLQQVEQRIQESGQLAHRLESQTKTVLDQLESLPQPFKRKQDAEKVAILVKALSDIIKTPVLNSEGKLNFAVLPDLW